MHPPDANAPLAGATLIMSGGSRGIGLAIAERAARDGATLAIIAKTARAGTRGCPLRSTPAARAIEAAGGNVLPIVGDIRDEDGVAAAVQRTVEQFGGLDIVVNNASAINLAKPPAPPAKCYDLILLNARGHVRADRSRAATPRKVGEPARADAVPAAGPGPQVAGPACAFHGEQVRDDHVDAPSPRMRRDDGIAANCDQASAATGSSRRCRRRAATRRHRASTWSSRTCSPCTARAGPATCGPGPAAGTASARAGSPTLARCGSARPVSTNVPAGVDVEHQVVALGRPARRRWPRLIADALLTTMSTPAELLDGRAARPRPRRPRHGCRRRSAGRCRPPLRWPAPPCGSCRAAAGPGSSVLAMMAMFAPSRAARLGDGQADAPAAAGHDQRGTGEWRVRIGRGHGSSSGSGGVGWRGAAHQPRARRSPRCGRSTPSVESSPRPG